ncbi:hypothetical protein BCI9360_02339 [Bacillus sp. CECT 9360]|nr:hypothetical protein BCI9360_02339 [Bacillus sp. CECT 9360]
MEYICLQDWEMKGVIYFKKGKAYKGRNINNPKATEGFKHVKITGEYNMRMKCETGCEYFKIV